MEITFSEQEDTTERVKTATRKRTAAKQTETLGDAFQRLETTLKWTDEEWANALRVRSALESNVLQRNDDKKRLSKKEMFELFDTLRDLERKQRVQHLVDNAPANYRVITDIKTFRQFISDLYDEPLTAWDTETTGLDLFDDRIVGYSVWLPKADYGVYVPFYHGKTFGSKFRPYGTIPSYRRFEGQLQADVALENVREYLEDSNRKTVWHNAKFDLHMLRNHGINVADPYWDTQVCAFILNETEPHNLKKLAPKYLGVESDMFADLWGDDPTVYDKPIVPSGIYAVKDAHLTFKLYEFQKRHIDRLDGLRYVFEQIEMPQIRISLEAERTGFGLDVVACKQLEEQFTREVDDDISSIRSQFGVGDDFNINSPQQLQRLLYDQLGLPDISKSVNPKLEPRSTAAAVLTKLAEVDERVQTLVDYRMKQKLLSTYVSKFPTMTAGDGRLHYQLVQFGTETGRYSSKQYGDKKNKKGINAQNVPARNKVAMRVRTLLIP